MFTINQVSCETNADIVALPAGFFGTGAFAFSSGQTNPRDGVPGIYEYDSAATDTADGFFIIQQSAISGAGRWFRLTAFDPVQADWNQTNSSARDFIKNKPGLTNLVPTGTITMWGAASAPTGWLSCDGSAVNRTTYADLFSIIGTTYGLGNGTTTFNIPDFRQRGPLGKATSGTGSNLGDAGGNIDHTHSSPLTTGTPSATVQATALLGGAASTDHTHNVTIPADNPPYLTVNFIIKT